MKLTDTVHVAPAASDDPQVLDSPNPAAAEIEEIEAAAVPVFLTVTVCAALVVFTVWLPNDSEDGDAVSVALPVPPLPPEPSKIWNSDTCAALQPVLAVNESCRYWSFVPEGRVKLTVLPVAGLKV